MLYRRAQEPARYFPYRATNIILAGLYHDKSVASGTVPTNPMTDLGTMVVATRHPAMDGTCSIS